MLDGLALASGEVWGRTGFSEQTPWVALVADERGVRRLQVPDLGRLEVAVGAGVDAGYLVANGTLRDLPPGSHLDPASGYFTWAPGLAYIGAYRLAFVRGGEQITVDITVRPRATAAPGETEIRMALDTPQAGEAVAGTFTVAGWALDPQAAIGSGIEAVHVWAQRRDVPGADPVFLGAAALDGPRADVAQAYGAQFLQPGFSLTTSGLASGTYEVTAYAWNCRTARWEDARTVSITIH